MPLIYAPSLPLREFFIFRVRSLSLRDFFFLQPRPPDLKKKKKKVRLALNGRVRPVVRDRVFFSAVMVALGHAGIIMSRDSSMGAGT